MNEIEVYCDKMAKAKRTIEQNYDQRITKKDRLCP